MEWRRDTPACERRIHLNNAGAALMPRPVVEVMQAHVALEAEIGGYEAADAKSAAIDSAYAEVATLVNARPANIALVANATAGFIQAVSSFDFSPGDTIITTQSDYTSYQIQLLSLAKRAGVTVLHAADRPGGGVDPDSVRTLVQRSRCRLVTVSWIPTHSGLVQDVEAVGQVCAELGVPYHVDACQAVGQLPIDVHRLRCDYLSATARKFLRGPRGIGFLYASDAALERGDYPLFVDMRGATWVAPNDFRVQPTARRYEDWEFAYSLVLGLGAAVRYARDVGIDTAHARANSLASTLRNALATVEGVRVLEQGPVRCALVTAEIAGRHADEVVPLLRERGVNTAATLQWYGLRDLGARHIESAVRFSPHYYNTDAEIAEAVSRLRQILE